MLATWWPRLLPGVYGGAAHPLIRVGHAVRTLLTDGENAPRRTELAHGLGYWAARYRPVEPPVPLPRRPHRARRWTPYRPSTYSGELPPTA